MGFFSYAELHCVSNFTFLRGASQPAELVAQAAALKYSAIAITDECSLAGIVRAHEEAKKHAIKLIIGGEIRLIDGPRLVLLATSHKAYSQLSELITIGRRAAEKGEYELRRADLEQGIEQCLALLCPEPKPNSEHAQWLSRIFPNRAWLLIELLGRQGDRTRLNDLLNYAAQHQLKAVAAGDVHMHVKERRLLQDTLTAIRLGSSVQKLGHDLHANGERYLRPLSRLQKIYPPELLEETTRIAELCQFRLDEIRYEYPRELVPADKTATAHLRELTYAGAQQRWPQGMSQKVQSLIEHELQLIAELNYEPYFLTVHDIVRFARSRDILCQGRGSAANSAVCYCLGITEVDPSRMEMLFERFISKERDEPPDIDVDFEHQRREEVIQYIYQKYGRHRAALAATVITYRPRSAFRDVGKALGLDLIQVDRLAKNASWWDGGKIKPERIREAGFDPDTPIIAHVIDLVNTIVGFPRHLSQHVGGFVISQSPLSQLVPIENASMPDRTVIQWDKDDLEALGLMKVDVLALGMLSAIHRALKLVETARGYRLRMQDIPAEDPYVYRMTQKADTVGVFQIESRAQMAMLPRLKPKCFYDLVIEISLVRPGPIQGNMVHPYLRRRQGLEAITYPNPAVYDVLQRTLGIPIFQEQVIKLAMVAAGFTAGEADQLRRAMAAWRRRGTLEPFERRLRDGMVNRGYSEQFAQQVFEQIKGFGEYGFPESHAASFALLVYVSAWLKYYEPAAFTCALLNSLPMGFYGPSQLVQDARRHKVEVLPVDVMTSEVDCTLENMSNDVETVTNTPTIAPTNGKIPRQAALRLGLRMIRSLSKSGAERLVQARRRQSFSSIHDLSTRAALHKNDLEALAAAGALESLSGHRYRARWEVMGLLKDTPLLQGPIQEALPLLLSPSEGQNIVADYHTTGLTLGRHPLALLRENLRQLRVCRSDDIRRMPHGRHVHIAGIVTARQRPGTATGVTFLTLEDEAGVFNVIVWRDIAERQRKELLNSRLLGVYGEVQREGEVIHIIARYLRDYSRSLGQLNTHSRDFH
jgi:error-prone DNA polymerase